MPPESDAANCIDKNNNNKWYKNYNTMFHYGYLSLDTLQHSRWKYWPITKYILHKNYDLLSYSIIKWPQNLI
jgi:hypothetical protein